MVLATAVTLGGALIVIGLLSTPLTMVEVDRFAGVKLLLLAPPLAALALYLLNGLWGARVDDPIAAANAPVRLYQLALGILIVGGAYVLQARSGNQSDITPSSFELALRSHLTSILSVRPRFKEFLIGFPALMLVPALTPADRRTFGWLLVLAIGMGLGDVVDTFSHLHTPLADLRAAHRERSRARRDRRHPCHRVVPARAVKPRFLLSGYYGFGNLGDEALLSVIVRTLRRRHAHCEIDVLSGDVEETARTYGVVATPRADPQAVRRAIAAADVVISGGGGLLQNATSLRSLVYYAGIVRLAVRANETDDDLRAIRRAARRRGEKWSFADSAAASRALRSATNVRGRCSSRCCRGRRSNAPPIRCFCLRREKRR